MRKKNKNYVYEPFLINPPKRLPQKRKKRKRNPLMIVNSKRKRGEKKMARKKRSYKKRKPSRLTVYRSKRGGVDISPFSRLASRSAGTHLNPFAGFSGLSANKKRRSIRRRRNPALSLPLVGRIAIPDMTEVFAGSAGFIAVKSLPTMVFPANWQTGIMGYASKGITLIGVSMLSSKFLGRKVGNAVAMGGAIAIASELLGQLLVKAGMPVSLYEPTVGLYEPTQV